MRRATLVQGNIGKEGQQHTQIVTQQGADTPSCALVLWGGRLFEALVPG